MPVKYWSFAGLLLTDWCNAECASCYLCCSPRCGRWMEVDDAISVWRGLIAASPHGCRVHLGGGEPFGDVERLLMLCQRAKAEGLGPLEKVETNAFWATGEQVVRERLGALDAAGMGKLVISADPYHQQFVPLERCRLAARVAEEVLGAERVQVRWRDWLADGFNTDELDEPRRRELFAAWAAAGRDRLNGRAAEALARDLPGEPAETYRDETCREPLLRSRHVHVGPEGRVYPGVCAGVTLGTLGPAPAAEDVAEFWQGLYEGWDERPVLSVLACEGPFGLSRLARPAGFLPRERYASKCHLCWEVRRFLARNGLHADELGPRWMYEGAPGCPAPSLNPREPRD